MTAIFYDKKQHMFAYNWSHIEVIYQQVVIPVSLFTNFCLKSINLNSFFFKRSYQFENFENYD